MSWRFRPLALLPAVVTAGMLAAGALAAPAASAAPAAGLAADTSASLCPDAATAALGPYVCVFTPSMTQAQVQADLNAVAAQQVPVAAQFTSSRYSLLFEPGTYGSKADPLVFQVGYYTQVAGLGALPSDVVVNGAIEVFNNLCTAGTSNCNADDNFWRSMSNLELNVDLPSSPPAYAPPALDAYGPYCANSAEFWAASQAAPMRRVIVNGSVVTQDYCASNNYASGGFMADSQVSGDMDFYGNQQYMVRDSSIGGANGCPGGLWNMVFSGVAGAPAPVFTGNCQQNTVEPASSRTEEQPFLYGDAASGLNVLVPSLRAGATGTSWSSGTEAGTVKPLSGFYVASPSSSVADINGALSHGQNLLLTPGVYDLAQAIHVTRPGTLVIGMGFATLVPTAGNQALTVDSGNGVKVSGLIIDAGPVNSPALMTVGASADEHGAPGNPDLVSDVFFRVGGAESSATSATVSLVDNASESIIDDVWAWRADHGNDVGWTDNQGDTGLAVTGDDVTAYGLAVEHYQKSEVTWSGNGGNVTFFQNELPYDVPDQASWNESSSFSGYPAFQVAPGVSSFTGTAMGSYVVFTQTTATLHVSSAFQAPAVPGVQFSNAFGVWIGGSYGLDSVVNGAGGPVSPAQGVNAVDVASYTG